MTTTFIACIVFLSLLNAGMVIAREEGYQPKPYTAGLMLLSILINFSIAGCGLVLIISGN